jgi:hypothetical protein
MISSTTKSFRERYRLLPREVRELAYKNFKAWLRDPAHPSIRFKKVGNFWSARVGRDYRALAIWKEDRIEWFLIGRHDEYLRLIAA